MAMMSYTEVETAGRGRRTVDGLSRARPVQTLARPPRTAEVVVIGGGIIGTLTACYLARTGVDVVLCEKGAIGGEASGRAAGRISGSGQERIKQELIVASKRLWQGLDADLGIDSSFRAEGFTQVFNTRADSEKWTRWIDQLDGIDPDAGMVRQDEISRSLGTGTRYVGAYRNTSDGSTESHIATPAIAEAAGHLGAKLVAPCAVRGISMAAGRIHEVITEHGVIRASTVVLAGGAWSSVFLHRLGLKLPLENIFGTCLSVSGITDLPGSWKTPTLSWRRQLDGRYTLYMTNGSDSAFPSVLQNIWTGFGNARHKLFGIDPDLGDWFLRRLGSRPDWSYDDISPFEKLRVLEPAGNPVLDRLVPFLARKDFPIFRRLKVEESWTGAIATTPDNMPTISDVESHPGLFLATGFTYGLTMAPAAANSVAALVTGEAPPVDLTLYNFRRYGLTARGNRPDAKGDH